MTTHPHLAPHAANLGVYESQRCPLLLEKPPRQRHAGVPRPLVLHSQVLAAPAYDAKREIGKERSNVSR